ncbi:RNA polymerase sigma factor [Defluviimonas sp. WL0024]|uniref:RNA polymerase sigma factor n=2 Tax=Albidovulum TaxID=205889 RepID=A0ABT3J287_9RHOB|nr:MULTISPECIES: RNA polymerase sigma factor [Defluviimonas]MCU9847769.1 RNA polymerase sigma factor [Defluviimonas sp. WL0024]MCW3781802.1 RNA polymerase sigma factor [Defluviimonas salinarum]
MGNAIDALAEASDEALLILYGNGDPEAARILTARLAPVAYRVAARMLADPAEAEDVAQEAMLRLWRLAPDWQGGAARVSTWLYRVAANLATDRLRRRRTLPLDAAADPADERPGAVAGLVAQDRAAALEAALMRLPERQRQAVVLRHLEGLANPEIAEIMEVGVEAVESLVARGKRGLAEALAGKREELGFDDG